MIIANSAGNLLISPHPKWLEILNSIAAPLFILISGIMIALTIQKKSYSLRHFLYRGGFVVSAGVFLEVFIWSTWPFTIFEVLYCIGFCIPLTFLFLKIKSENKRWLLIVLIIAVTPFLQKFFGYTDYPTEIAFPFEPYNETENPTSVLNHYFIDGWFPLFPWMAFAFIGANLYKWRLKYANFKISQKFSVLILGAILVFAGFGLWKIFAPNLIVRDGYSELFYPPTIGFILWALGFILILFVVVEKFRNSQIFKPVIIFGNTALFVYLFHYLVIENVLLKFFENNLNGLNFTILIIFFETFLLISSAIYIKFKSTLK